VRIPAEGQERWQCLLISFNFIFWRIDSPVQINWLVGFNPKRVLAESWGFQHARCGDELSGYVQSEHAP